VAQSTKEDAEPLESIAVTNAEMSRVMAELGRRGGKNWWEESSSFNDV